MNDFDASFEHKPHCFGYRQTAGSDVQCKTCAHTSLCKSAVWGVLRAVRHGNLPANGYFPSELSAFREQHLAECHVYGMSDIQCSRIAQKIPIEVLEQLHERVLPPRSPEQIETAREMEEWFSDLDVLAETKPSQASEKSQSASASPTTSEHTAAPQITPMLPGCATAASMAPALSSGIYAFPMPKGRPYAHHTNDALTAELKQLIDQAFHITPAYGYSAVRDEFCAVHIEMNLRQQHAPRFRPTHRLQKELRSADEVTESRDRQVIDLHWRAHSKNKPTATVSNYATILNADPFDLAAAERFAQEEWSPAAKAIHLHLTEAMQWENAILQNANIRKAWAVIERGDVRKGNLIKQAGAPHIEQELREAVYREKKPQVLASIPGMVDAWKARRIVGDNLAETVRMIALMSGSEARDRKAVKRTLASLDKYLGTRPSRAK